MLGEIGGGRDSTPIVCAHLLMAFPMFMDVVVAVDVLGVHKVQQYLISHNE